MSFLILRFVDYSISYIKKKHQTRVFKTLNSLRSDDKSPEELNAHKVSNQRNNNLLGHAAEWQSSQDGCAINAGVPLSAGQALHHHIVQQGRVEHQSPQHAGEMVGLLKGKGGCLQCDLGVYLNEKWHACGKF